MTSSTGCGGHATGSAAVSSVPAYQACSIPLRSCASFATDVTSALWFAVAGKTQAKGHGCGGRAGREDYDQCAAASTSRIVWRRRAARTVTAALPRRPCRSPLRAGPPGGLGGHTSHRWQHSAMRRAGAIRVSQKWRTAIVGSCGTRGWHSPRLGHNATETAKVVCRNGVVNAADLAVPQRNRRTARRRPGTPVWRRPAVTPGIGVNTHATSVPSHGRAWRPSRLPQLASPNRSPTTRCGAAASI